MAQAPHEYTTFGTYPFCWSPCGSGTGSGAADDGAPGRQDRGAVRRSCSAHRSDPVGEQQPASSVLIGEPQLPTWMISHAVLGVSIGVATGQHRMSFEHLGQVDLGARRDPS